MPMPMTFLDQARAQAPRRRCPKCNLAWDTYSASHTGSDHCFQLADEREIYRAGWIKLSDLPEWEKRPLQDWGEDWWPRKVIQAFNARHGRGAIMLRRNPRVGYTQNWVRVWAVQVLMERMAGVDGDAEAGALSVEEGVDLLKSYHDAFAAGVQAGGPGIPEDMLRPDEIAVHLAGSVPIPRWHEYGWFRAWLDLSPEGFGG